MMLIRKSSKQKYHIAAKDNPLRPVCQWLAYAYLQPDIPGALPPPDSSVCYRCKARLIKEARKEAKREAKEKEKVKERCRKALYP